MARLTAWRVLRSGSQTPMRMVSIAAERAGLDDRNRSLARQIVGTEVRRRGTLRALVAAFSKGKPNAELAAHLRIGLAQLFFMENIPDHAALSETVHATTDTLGLSKGRYVNAVLRQALRSRRSGPSGDPRCDLIGSDWHFDKPVFRDPKEHPLLWAEDALSIPAALMKRWTKNYGEEAARAIGRIALEEPDLSVRIVSGEREALIGELQAQDLSPAPGGHASIILLPRREAKALLATEAFGSGRITIQGEAALRAAELMPIEAEFVLDMCAAPGGKAAVLAGRGQRVIAADLSAMRLTPLMEGMRRLNCAQNVRTVVSDGGASFGEKAQFDGVLVDAPCSNTGVLARRPGARWRYGPKAQASLVELQTRLVAQAAELVRPGGYLVYSTCSLEREENQQRAAALCRENSSFELRAEHVWTPQTMDAGGPIDGGYPARLHKRA